MRMTMRAFFYILVATMGCVCATPTTYELWRTKYPGTTQTQTMGCSVCHTTSAGGPPWNSYGRDLVFAFRFDLNRSDIELAMEMIEEMDSDGDGNTNIEEITADTPAGWTSGDNNVFLNFTEQGVPVVTRDQPPVSGYLYDLDPVEQSAYESWVSLYFPGETDESVIGASADPNQDGISNLLAFYLGTDPTATSAQNALSMSVQGAYLIVSHGRRTEAAALAATLHMSESLSGWSDVESDGVVPSVTTDGVSAGVDLIEYQIPLPAGGRVFSYLEVSE